MFVSQSARLDPTRLFVGVDANPRPLEKISEKIYRKVSKGGLPNALFLQAALEDLPSELEGIADEVRVHFPWGSLLRAVAVGDQLSLQALRRVCVPGARLIVIIGLDPERDRAEVLRLGLETLTVEYIDSTLTPRYRNAGFEIVERRELTPAEWNKIDTSWAKRLRSDGNRKVFYIEARAIDVMRDFVIRDA